jgi:hypothetical protein
MKINKLFLTALASILLPWYCATQILMLNEVSQGSGSSEYVEFVVAGTPTCDATCLNIQHMIIDDNNGTFASGSGVGISNGAMRFSNDPLWSCVPYGTIIVIYNAAAPNLYMPADDYSLTDDPVLILPSTSPLLQGTTVSPSIANPLYAGNASWTTGGATWGGALVMGNSNDSFQVRDANGVLMHAVSWGNNNQNNILYFSPALDLSFMNTNSNNYNATTNWSSTNTAAFQTPGVPNSPANATWINSMYSTSTTITLGNISHN